MKLSELKEAEYNPRSISEKALEGLKTSIEEFGDISGITFNKKTGNLVSGHQRVKALIKKYGDLEFHKGNIQTPDGKEFKVRFVEWEKGKEKAANVAANNPFTQGEFNHNLQNIVAEIKLNAEDLSSKLLINELELKPIFHESGFGFAGGSNKEKANLSFTIGEFVFKVDRQIYLSWIDDLKFEVGFTEDAVIAEIKRRLKIEC